MTSKGVKTRSAACEYDLVDVEELNAAETRDHKTRAERIFQERNQ